MAHGSAPSSRFVLFFSALRYRNYCLYWFGQCSSVLAQTMEHVAKAGRA